ncbi:MAG: ISAs1 family transposase [Gammaproteobacteria bacterium]|nr:ISAs1 family transposase [Gammaproteobacteria bacterium]
MMPCTAKKTFRAAQKAKCHLLVQVKENQSRLLRKVEQIAQTQTPKTCHQTTDGNRRKRFETRIVEAFDARNALRKTAWTGYIRHIVRVERITHVQRARDGLWDRRHEIAFYACSDKISAKKASHAIRGHWCIENKNHYVRDVSMFEDNSRIRINPGIFARMRSFALNILRTNGEENIAGALWQNALDIKRPLNYRLK